MSLQIYLMKEDRTLNYGANSRAHELSLHYSVSPELSSYYSLSPAELQSYFVVALNGADDSREHLYAR